MSRVKPSTESDGQAGAGLGGRLGGGEGIGVRLPGGADGSRVATDALRRPAVHLCVGGRGPQMGVVATTY